jgi:transcriptional regulator with GAF, ATPase, and Fis domain
LNERWRVQIGDLQTSGSTKTDTLKDVEREHIMQILRETNGVIGGRLGAAVRLGLPRTTLMSKMDRLGILRDSRAWRFDVEGDSQKALAPVKS